MLICIHTGILPRRLWHALGKASCFTGHIMDMQIFLVPPCELSSKRGLRDCGHCMGIFQQKAM